MNAEGGELIHVLGFIAGRSHVLDELARDVEDSEGEELIQGEIGIT